MKAIRLRGQVRRSHRGESALPCTKQRQLRYGSRRGLRCPRWCAWEHRFGATAPARSDPLICGFFLRGVIEFPNAVCNLEQNNQTDYNRGSANKWIPIGALSDNEAGYQNPKGKIVIFQVESLLSVWYTELKQEPLLGEVGKPQPLMSLGFERFNQNG